MRTTTDQSVIDFALEYGEEATDGEMFAAAATSPDERVDLAVATGPDRVIMPDQFPHRRPTGPTMTLLV